MAHSSSIVPQRALNTHHLEKPEVRVLPGLSDLIPHEEEPPPPKTKRKISVEDEQLMAKRAQAQSELEAARTELAQVQADIEQARLDADYIRQQALTDAQSIRDKARMDGYAAGADEAKKEYDQVVQRENREFAKSVQALANAKQEICEEMEPAVLDLSMHCAERIVKEALNRNDELFMNIVKDTIKEVEDAEEIVLRINKKEYDRFFADAGNEYAELLKSSGVKVRQDMSVESGECIVETEFGTLRSGVQTQLERMRSALEGN